MLIVVTGAAGFIGSNIIQELNRRGIVDIIAVDNLVNGNKCCNLAHANILDFIDKEDFRQELAEGEYDQQIDYIFHQGACANTSETDGRYMMKNNYDYSCVLLDYAQKNEVPFIYASSAAVYGPASIFIEDRENEFPLNVYAYSKMLFDHTVRRYFNSGLRAPVVGLRYFNVFGYPEFHKGKMASVVLHNFKQYQQHRAVKLFASCHGYGNGEQCRDFIAVEDVIRVIMHFFAKHTQESTMLSGIFNCGTSIGRTFNDLALATVNACRMEHGDQPIELATAIAQGIIEYIPFPAELLNKYQTFTAANNSRLIHQAKYNAPFLTLEQGVSNYVKLLTNNSSYPML